MTDKYRLNPAMGGGALLDVGCYQAHTWVALTAEELEIEISELSRVIGTTSIDLTTDAVEEFPVTNAFVELVKNVSRVIGGDEGWIVSSADSMCVAHIFDQIARHRGIIRVPCPPTFTQNSC